jgi:hypothetical protein
MTRKIQFFVSVALLLGLAALGGWSTAKTTKASVIGQGEEITRDDRLDPNFDAKQHLKGKVTLTSKFYGQRFTQSATTVGTLPTGEKIAARAARGEITCTRESCDLDFFLVGKDGTESKATLHKDGKPVARKYTQTTTITTCINGQLCFYFKHVEHHAGKADTTTYHRDCYDFDCSTLTSP